MTAGAAVAWFRARLQEGEPARRLQADLLEWLANPTGPLPESLAESQRLREERDRRPEVTPLPSRVGTRFPEQRRDGYVTTWAEWDASFSTPNETNAGARQLRVAALAVRARARDELIGASLRPPDTPERMAEWHERAGPSLDAMAPEIAAVDAALRAPSFVHESAPSASSPLRESTREWLPALFETQSLMLARFHVRPHRSDRPAALTGLALLATRLEGRTGREVSVGLGARKHVACCLRDLLAQGDLRAGEVPAEVQEALDVPPGLLRRWLLELVVETCEVSDWALTPEGIAFAGRVPDSEFVPHPVAGRRVLKSAARALDFAVAEDRTGDRDLAAAYVRAQRASDAAKQGLDRMLAGGRAGTIRMFTETLAACRLARTAIALVRFRETTGAWPRSLDDVATDAGPESLVDPFTGDRFVYESAEARARLASRGCFAGQTPDTPEELAAEALLWELGD